MPEFTSQSSVVNEVLSVCCFQRFGQQITFIVMYGAQWHTSNSRSGGQMGPQNTSGSGYIQPARCFPSPYQKQGKENRPTMATNCG